MPKNFNNFTDAMVTAALADLATANKVWIVLVDENEASIDVTDAFDDLTWSTSQKFSVTSVSVTERVIDLGGPFVFVSDTPLAPTETPGALVVITDDPANSPDLILAQNILTFGAAYAFADRGDLSVDALLIRFGYQDET